MTGGLSAPTTAAPAFKYFLPWTCPCSPQETVLKFHNGLHLPPVTSYIRPLAAVDCHPQLLPGFRADRVN